MRYIFLILLTGIYFSLFSQHPGGMTGMQTPEGIIYGSVFEKIKGEPVEYANIVVYSHRDSSIVTGAITDKNGTFRIDNVNYGRFFVEIQFIGFGKHTIPEIIIKPDNKIVDLGRIEIELSAEMLDEVRIEATVDRVEYRLDRRIVNVSQDLSAAGGTAVDALQNVPGVQVDIEDNVSIRGTQSFLVLIDGRPSPVQGSEALQQIPANSIESIEIITNPSARYDAEGVGGIINVIMKRDRKPGYNAQVTANYGSFNSYGGDFLVNIRKEKLNFFIGGNYNENIYRGSGHEDRRNYLPGDTTTFYLTTKNDREMIRNSGAYRIGLDYNISESDIITITGRYNTNVFGRSLNSTAAGYMLNKNEGIPFNEYNYITNNNSKTNWGYYSGDFNYLKKFLKPGHELQVYFSYAENFSDKNTWFSEEEIGFLLEPSGIIDSTRTIDTGSGNEIIAKADYEIPLFENSKLEAGYQIRMSEIGNDYKYQKLSITDDWNTINFNPYNFLQNIQSGYMVFSNTGDKIGYMLGLRTEYTDRLFKQTLTSEEWAYNDFDFFPSMHLSYKLPKDIQVMASYSRRLQRPRPWNLDPFIDVVDPNNVRRGNPLLEPEYTNSMELNLQKRFNTNFISFETYYRHTTNKIERFIEIDSVNPEIFVSTFKNIGESFAAGSELTANLNITKWWNFNISGSAFYYEIVDINNAFSWTSRLNNTFRIFNKGTSIQLSGFYFGRSIRAQGEMKPMYMINAGIRQDFFDRKLSLSFNVRDVFRTMGHEMIFETDEFYSYTNISITSPTFRLSLTYNINDFTPRRERQVEIGVGRVDESL